MKYSNKTIFTATLVGLLTSLSAGAAQAQVVLVTSNTFHPFYISTSVTHGNLDHVQDGGGNIGGVGSSLNGEFLIAAYCVDLFNPVYVNSTYTTTTITHDGAVYGNPVSNAGAVAWLIRNFGASAVGADQENALQGAIWRTMYGTNFEVDGADNAKTGNTPGLISAYQGYMLALGASTAPIGSVDWISPAGGPIPGGYTINQGLVGIRASSFASSAPEPGTLAFLGLGSALVLVKRRRK